MINVHFNPEAYNDCKNNIHFYNDNDKYGDEKDNTKHDGASEIFCWYNLPHEYKTAKHNTIMNLDHSFWDRVRLNLFDSCFLYNPKYNSAHSCMQFEEYLIIQRKKKEIK